MAEAAHEGNMQVSQEDWNGTEEKGIGRIDDYVRNMSKETRSRVKHGGSPGKISIALTPRRQ